MITLDAKLIVQLIRDPVMAAYVLMKVELDDFQGARLRTYWFVPEKIDSSGWGTGKTIVEFIYANLRAILIPRQRVGVYYPVFQTGKDEFWRYFGEISTPIYNAQFRRHHNKLGEWKEPGCWRREFKNGSAILLPAPGFVTDANNQASRSFNTLIVGEYTQASTKGEGVDELIGRVRGPCFNKNHPIWCNHLLLSAHAESPTHPAFKYYKGAKAQIAGKYKVREAIRNALITFCYLDWSPKYAKLYRADDTIAKSKRTLTDDEFSRRLLGVWRVDGRGWYAAVILTRCLRSARLPEVGRMSQRAVYTLGCDFAPGQSAKSDFSGFVVWKGENIILQKGEPPRLKDQALGLGPRLLEQSLGEYALNIDGEFWKVGPVFGRDMQDKSTRQLSGYIHWLHRLFGFSSIVMDPAGGGAWVYKDMLEPAQLIENTWMPVTPLSTAADAMALDRQGIVVWFKRGSELDSLWLPHFLQGDEGIIEAAHRMFRDGFEKQEIEWPQLLENRPRGEILPQVAGAQMSLDRAWKQLTKIRVKTNPQGIPLRTKRGFYSFESPIKKDLAYASLYGFVGMLQVLRGIGVASEVEDDFVGVVTN